jgi:hypothetical protein
MSLRRASRSQVLYPGRSAGSASVLLRLTLTDRLAEGQPVGMAQSPAPTDIEALLLAVLAVLALLGVYVTVF